MTEIDTLRCARHPNVETSLRCGKCGTPICPKCMVESPVGARCPDCAKLTKIPTYRVSSTYYLRAIAAGLVSAIVIGIIWGIIESYLPFRFFSLIIAAGIGYLIGEAIGRSVNRKRGTALAVIGAFSVAVSFAVTYLADYIMVGYLNYGAYRIVFTLVSIAIGSYMAVIRLR
jgi:hypothetical protein